MAQKTPTELAREVQQEVGILRTELGFVKQVLERTDLTSLRERLAVLEDRVLGAALALLSSLLVNLIALLVKK
jgi:hypothetical protein